MNYAQAIAPASIANLAVGFDLLGQAFSGCHDRVSARRTSQTGVKLGQISGLLNQLPTNIADNTALRGADAVLQTAGNPFGVQIEIEKAIPVSAGLGGSAASSVAAVLATNALLEQPLPKTDLFRCALEGERASSDPPPADNVAACLYGGLVLLLPGKTDEVVQIPAPSGVSSLVFHPALKIETGASRKALAKQVKLSQTLDFAAHIAAFTAACYRDDIGLLRQVMRDVLIEPQRAASISPFSHVQAAALGAGAICCSISGSGPSIFAWVQTTQLQTVQSAMVRAFQTAGIKANCYHSALSIAGASVTSNR